MCPSKMCGVVFAFFAVSAQEVIAEGANPETTFTVSVAKRHKNTFTQTLDHNSIRIPGQTKTNKELFTDGECKSTDSDNVDVDPNFPRSLEKPNSKTNFERLFYKCNEASALTHAIFGDAARETAKEAEANPPPAPDDDKHDRLVVRVVSDTSDEHHAPGAGCPVELCLNGTARHTTKRIYCLPCGQ